MFADISGSTRLFEIVGDAKARAGIAKVLKELTEIVHNNNGTVIKTIGDEIMCTFTTATDAANAACTIQERLDEGNPAADILGDDVVVLVRIGLHYGPAIIEDNDVFGDAVNVAARMAAQAKGGQIITSSTTVEELEPETQDCTRFIDNAPVKGKAKPIEIYELLWEEDATRMASILVVDKQPAEVSLKLQYHSTVIELNSKRPSVVMGRSKNCDLPIAERLASRQHVRIELRREKFYIIDQSTNGTFVNMEGGNSFLRREEMPVTSNGKLSLGRPINNECTEFVQFVLEQ